MAYGSQNGGQESREEISLLGSVWGPETITKFLLLLGRWQLLGIPRPLLDPWLKCGGLGWESQRKERKTEGPH